MRNREAWGYAVARCGDAIALLVVAIVSLTVSFIADDWATKAICWVAAVVLLILQRRALRAVES
jgi:hypothetical protein